VNNTRQQPLSQSSGAAYLPSLLTLAAFEPVTIRGEVCQGVPMRHPFTLMYAIVPALILCGGVAEASAASA
jgi:hypothetical protein